MPTNTGDFRTPGQLIQALLDERGWSQNLLAIILNVSPTVVTRMVNAQRPIDAKMALALSETFEMSAERFLALQRSYDLAIAEIQMPSDPQRAIRAKLYGGLPIREMAERGWISVDDIRDTDRVEKELAAFFGVSSVRDIEFLPHAPKKTDVDGDVTPAQLAWLYRVRSIASEMIVGPFSDIGLQRAMNNLQDLLLSAEEARHVPKILADAGTRFVVVETIGSAKIDGVCFWLDARSPVVGMSMRHDRIDNFWFVLRHELEHARRGHGKDRIRIDIELEKEGTEAVAAHMVEEEKQANEAAAEFCVPENIMRQFIDRKAPMFPDRDILGFAKTIGVHPGLVAGQLRYRTGRYNRFHRHSTKIRSIVVPSAASDGWGDIAPVGDA